MIKQSDFCLEQQTRTIYISPVTAQTDTGLSVSLSPDGQHWYPTNIRFMPIPTPTTPTPTIIATNLLPFLTK